MIIPVKCVTCGTVLANKYRFYQEKVREKKLAQGAELNETIYLTETSIDKTAEGEVLDILQLYNICCRRHMLTHIDIE